jgi:hypothetical protein
MKLIFLHGAPASGKLTVAQALLRTVPGRLFDNHAAIDLARTVFDFGAPGFWPLVHRLRCTVLDAAARQGVPLVVTTYRYSEPDDRPALEEFDAILARHGGDVLPVFLHCSREETLRRLGGADRAQRRKITSAGGFDAFAAQFNIVPVPRADCLKLDSASRSAEATAQEIIRHFALSSSQQP